MRTSQASDKKDFAKIKVKFYECRLPCRFRLASLKSRARSRKTANRAERHYSAWFIQHGTTALVSGKLDTFSRSAD